MTSRRNSCSDAVFATPGGSLFRYVIELGKNDNYKESTQGWYYGIDPACEDLILVLW